MADRYRKKPVEIEAVQFTADTVDEVMAFVGHVPSDGAFVVFRDPKTGVVYDLPSTAPEDIETEPVLQIRTLEGVMTGEAGDWIIKGVEGEFYPCKPAIFEKTYDRVIEAEG